MSNYKIFILISTLCIFYQKIQAVDFELINKTKTPFEFSIGTVKAPSYKVFNQISSQSKYRYTYHPEKGDNLAIALRMKNAPDMTIVYEFNYSGSKIHVQIVESKGIFKLEPQSFVINNIKQSQIKLIGSRGRNETCEKIEREINTLQSSISIKQHYAQEDIHTEKIRLEKLEKEKKEKGCK